MNQGGPETIASRQELLAHALMLQLEAAQRYEELAQCMEVHHMSEVASLFRVLAELYCHGVAEIEDRVQPSEMPAPWNCKWGTPEAPATPGLDQVRYMMSRCDGLHLALQCARQGRDFFSQAAQAATDVELQDLAWELAAQVRHQAEKITEWMLQERCDFAVTDLDPPNMPE